MTDKPKAAPSPAEAYATERTRLLLTIPQAGERLAMSRTQVYRWMAVVPGRPTLPHLKLGRSRRIDAEALERFVAELNDWQGNQ